MNGFSVGIRIWFRTILINAILVGAGTFVTDGFFGMLAMIIAFVGGLIVTLPLLLLITPLVNLSGKLPYSIPARMVWLASYLVLMVYVFYRLVFGTIDRSMSIEDKPFFYMLVCGAGMALTIAIWWSRGSLTKLYER